MENRDTADFVARLAASDQRVNEWVLEMEKQHHRLFLPAKRLAPSHEKWKKYTDPCDIKADMRLEHKCRNLEFTGREDFPYDTVLVNEAYKIASHEHWPALMHILVNRKGDCAAVVYGYTQQYWKKGYEWDSTRDKWCLNWYCPKDKVRFCHPNDVLMTRLPKIEDPPEPKQPPPWAAKKKENPEEQMLAPGRYAI